MSKRNTGGVNPQGLHKSDPAYEKLDVGPLTFVRYCPSLNDSNDGVELWAWYGGIPMTRAQIIASARRLPECR